MASGTAAPRRPKRWLKLLIWCGILVPALACGIGLFAFYGQISSIADETPAELKKLQAMGVQTEISDLSPKPAVTDAQNAAPIYGSLFLQLEALEAAPKNKDLIKLLDTFYNSKEPAPQLKPMLEALQAQHAFFSEADKLGAKSGADFKRDYGRGFATLFPELGDQRRLVKWQCSRARAQWMTGDRDGAIRTLKNTFQIGNHLRTDSVLIGHLVFIASQAYLNRTLSFLVEDAKSDVAALRKIKALLDAQSVPSQKDLRYVFGGEVALGRQGIRNTKDGKTFASVAKAAEVKDASGGWVDLLISNSKVQQMYEARYLNVWRVAFDEMPKDLEDWVGLKKTMVAVNERIDANKSFDNVMNRVVFPVFGNAVDASARAVADRRLLQLSLELLLKRPSGLPADLSAFGRLAIDPFTGKPMKYVRKGQGFKVWSFGPDQEDQGGVPRISRPTGSKTFDLVMQFDF